MKKSLCRVITLLVIVLGCTTPVVAALSDNPDYEYVCYEGKPGNKGAQIAGHFSRDNDGITPRAFYREGIKKQEKYIWIGADVYYKGDIIRESWYYFEETNFVANRWKEVEGKWYYLINTGAVSGWYRVNSQYYYFDPVECFMWKSGDVERDGQLYTIGSDGVARAASELGYSGSVVSGGDSTGWSEDHGKWYVVRDGVRLRQEWLKDGEFWYYLGADSYLYMGIHMIDGEVYNFDRKGHMVTSGTGYYEQHKYTFGSDGRGISTAMTTDEKINQSKVVDWMAGSYAIYSKEVSVGEMFGGSYNVQELLSRDWGITEKDGGMTTIASLAATTAVDKDTKAWDYSRAMMLCNALNEAGYITMEEKLSIQLVIAPKIQQNFGSWEEFNECYMNGYRRWANTVGRADNIAHRELMYKLEREDKRSAFLLPWKLDLSQDW